MMAAFMNGLTLNQLFYEEVVAPIVTLNFPGLKYSAALIGWGSEVLGFDDAQSMDHNWGPRMQLFLEPQAHANYHEAIIKVLDDQLPSEFRGYPTAFPLVINDVESTSKHNIEVETIRGYFGHYLGCDPYGEMSAVDWLTCAEFNLLAVTSGRVFHDDSDALESIRRKFQYYPKDVWLYMLAAQWDKIFEEQAFVGRSGDVGDELGSMVIAARQVRNLMKLCFLMERMYAPYSKWFGTAFAHLACAEELHPVLMDVLHAQEWKARQEALARAYEIVARMHNALAITVPLTESATFYHGRPYLVVGDGRYVAELKKAIMSEEVKNIPNKLSYVRTFAGPILP